MTAEATQGSEPEVPPPPSYKDNIVNAAKDPGSRWRLAIMLVVMAAGLAAGWYALNRNRQPEGPAPAYLEVARPQIERSSPMEPASNPLVEELNQRLETQRQAEAVQRGDTYMADPPVMEPVKPPEQSPYYAQPAKAQSEPPKPNQALVQTMQQLTQAWSAAPPVQGVAFTEPAVESVMDAQGQPVLGIGAGTRLLATIESAVDSYSPGRVRAVIETPPYAGAVLLGSFQVDPNDHLAIVFDRLRYAGQTYAIDAVAIDPYSELPAIKGEVDHHFWRRIGIPLALGFLGNVANSYAQFGGSLVVTDTSTVVSQNNLDQDEQLLYAAGATAGQAVSLLPIGMTGVYQHPQVKLPPATPIGVLFLDDL